MKPFLLTTLFLGTQALHAQQVNFFWAQQISGSGSTTIQSVVTDNVGNCFVAGWFSGKIDVDPGPMTTSFTSQGMSDCFLLKLDATGNLVFARQIGGPLADEAFGITIDGNGNIILTGSFEGTANFNMAGAAVKLTSAGAIDAFVSKFGADGTHLWSKQIGGLSNDLGTGVKADIKGNILLVGGFGGTVDFDPGPAGYNLSATGSMDNFLVKLDGSGNFLWAATLGGDGEGGPAIDTDAAGNVYATGAFFGSYDFDPGPGNQLLNSNGTDIFVAKLDPAGKLIWVKQLGGNGYENGYAIAVTKTGKVLVTGDFSGMVDFDPDIGTFYLSNSGSYDAFICKLDTDGHLLWARQLGGTGLEQGLAIATDEAESVFTTGNFRAPGDYDPGPCVFPLVNNKGNDWDDIFISKLDAAGNFLWAKAITGSEWELSRSIAVANNGWIYTVGSFAKVADFDPGAGIAPLISNNSYDGFIQVMTPCLNSSRSEITLNSCGPVTVNCQTYNNSGTFTQVIENSEGCDSIITVHLSIGNYADTNIYVNACNNYNWRNRSLSSSGVYVDTLKNANGCFIIYHLHLTISNKSIVTQNAIACNQFYWRGKTFTNNGTYYDSIPNANGCDSIYILQLRINSSSIVTHNISSCVPYTWRGKSYTTTGSYSDTLVNSTGCDSIEVLNLTIVPAITSNIYQTICKGQQLEGYTATGTYSNHFTTAGGCDSVRILHLTVQEIKSAYMGPDQQICPGDSINLNPGTFDSYRWQNGSTANHFWATQPGTYTVNVTDNCGTSTDEIVLREGPCDIWFPTAFTPDNDGKNDFFKALGHADLKSFRLQVFNRWGQQVFSTMKYTEGWDGRIANSPMPTGIYVWVCQYQRRNDKASTQIKGTVLLVR